MVFFCSLKIFILAALKFLSVKPNIWLLHMQFLCLLTFWRRGHTLFLYTFYLFFEIKHFQAALGTVSPLSFWTCYLYVCRFPTWLNGKNLPAMQTVWVWSRVEKIPWRRKWQPTSVFLPGKSHGHGQRSLVGNSPWGCKRVIHGLATKQQYLHV